MLNQSLKLNTKIFNTDVEKKSTRQGFGEGLLKVGMDNEKIVALCADLTESTRVNLFADKFPERFIQVGIAEQNMASVASGLSAMGKIPFMASYAIFSPGRNWEQIRTTICYNNQNVKIIGSHAGLSVGPDGGSHQMLEDLALTTVMPNLVVISPCDYFEAKKATLAMAETLDPTYLRLARNDTPIITTEETSFVIGKGQIVFSPDSGLAQVGLIATGPILYSALMAAKKLEAEGYRVKVLNIATLKPLDQDIIISLAKETKYIVTIEDHQVTGGMGSAVASCLAENYPTKIDFIGVKDSFGQSGSPEELAKYYRIDTESIVEKIKETLKKN